MNGLRLINHLWAVTLETSTLIYIIVIFAVLHNIYIHTWPCRSTVVRNIYLEEYIGL